MRTGFLHTVLGVVFWSTDCVENAGITMRQRAAKVTSIRDLIDDFILHLPPQYSSKQANLLRCLLSLLPIVFTAFDVNAAIHIYILLNPLSYALEAQECSDSAINC